MPPDSSGHWQHPRSRFQTSRLTCAFRYAPPSAQLDGAGYHAPVNSASWLEEVKRRRVFRAIVAYGVVAFAVLQIIEPVMHGLSLPDWILPATLAALGIGFPVTLVLAWALDLKGGRIERTAPAPTGRMLLVL